MARSFSNSKWPCRFNISLARSPSEKVCKQEDRQHGVFNLRAWPELGPNAEKNARLCTPPSRGDIDGLSATSDHTDRTDRREAGPALVFPQ